MKINSLFFALLSLVVLLACSQDDSPDTTQEPTAENPTTVNPMEETENSAPDSFNLVSLENETIDSELTPTLTWEAATDTDNDAVTYDVYLDGSTSPETKIADLDSYGIRIDRRFR